MADDEADLTAMSPVALVAYLRGRPLPPEVPMYRSDGDDDSEELARLQAMTPRELADAFGRRHGR